MKKSRLFCAMLSAVMLIAVLCGSAWAVTLTPKQLQSLGQRWIMPRADGDIVRYSHVQQVVSVGENIYALVITMDEGYDDYLPSKIIKFDKTLRALDVVELKDGDKSGRNASKMIAVGSKLLVATMGGMQMKDGVFGDIWEVSIPSDSKMTAKQIYSTDNADLKAVFKTATSPSVDPKYLHTYQIAVDPSDGTVFTIIGYMKNSLLFKTTASDLSAGKIGYPFEDGGDHLLIDTDSDGIYGLVWDASSELLYVMDTSFSGTINPMTAIKKDFSFYDVSSIDDPTDEGICAAHIALLSKDGDGHARIAVFDGNPYATSSLGLVTVKGITTTSPAALDIDYDFFGDGSTPDLGGFGGDPMMFSFFDHEGKERLFTLNRDSYSGKNDIVKIFDITGATWKEVANGLKDKLFNTYGGVASGGDLYLAVFADAKKNGRIVRVDMADGYKVVSEREIGPAFAADPEVSVSAPELPKIPGDMLPDDVRLADSVQPFGDAQTLVDDISSSVLSEDSFTTNDNGQVTIKEDVAKTLISDAAVQKFIGEREDIAIDTITTLPMPVFSAKLSSGHNGKAAIVGFEIQGSALQSYLNSGALVLFKIKADGTSQVMQQVSSSRAMADGTFSVNEKGADEYATEIKNDGTTYSINVAIRDGGSLDLDGAVNGTVIDPIVIAKVTTKAITPDDPPVQSSSSGGACDLGSGAFVLALAAASALRRRYR